MYRESQHYLALIRLPTLWGLLYPRGLITPFITTPEPPSKALRTHTILSPKTILYERLSKLLVHGQTMDDLGGSYRFTRIPSHVAVRYRFALVKVKRPSNSLILLVVCPALYCPLLPFTLLLFTAFYCPLPALYCPVLLFTAFYCPLPALYGPLLHFTALHCPSLPFTALY